MNRPQELMARVERSLAPSDLALLHRGETVQAPKLKKISERHHRLAHLLAQGMGSTDAARVCGYDVSRVSILKSDPSFRQLIQHYRAQQEMILADTYQLLGGLTQDAIAELRQRIEDSPEEFTVKELVELMKTGADRSGHGPTKKEEITTNMNLSDMLANARKRVTNAQSTE